MLKTVLRVLRDGSGVCELPGLWISVFHVHLTDTGTIWLCFERKKGLARVRYIILAERKSFSLCRVKVKSVLRCLALVDNLGSSVSCVNLLLIASLIMNYNLGQWTVKSEPYHRTQGQYQDKSQLWIKVLAVLHFLQRAGLYALSIGGSWNINTGMSDCHQPPSAPLRDNSFSLASLLAAWISVHSSLLLTSPGGPEQTPHGSPLHFTCCMYLLSGLHRLTLHCQVTGCWQWYVHLMHSSTPALLLSFLSPLNRSCVKIGVMRAIPAGQS